MIKGAVALYSQVRGVHYQNKRQGHTLVNIASTKYLMLFL